MCRCGTVIGYDAGASPLLFQMSTMPNVHRPERAGSRVVAIAAGIVLLLHGAGTSAQQGAPPATPQQAPPVFRAGVEFVSVDVFPRRDGVFLEGLRAEDFQVFEDGTPQAVESFEFVRINPNPVDSERRDPTSQADGDRQAADPRNRVFVVYLDVNNTTVAGGHHARQPVVEFLKRTIGAQDLFGVMTAQTPAAQLVFGRRLESLEGELERHWTWGRADRTSILVVPESLHEERLLDCADLMPPGVIDKLQLPGGELSGKFRALQRMLVGRHREEQLLGSLDNLMMRLGSLRDERKNVLFVSEGWVPSGPLHAFTEMTTSEGRLPTVGVGPGGRIGLAQTQPAVVSDPSWCDMEIRRLTLSDFESDFRTLLTRASQANVSFYPIDVGGLRTAERPGGAVSTLRTMAENTDGFAIVGTNDLTGAVRRIEADLSAYYLLGYYSTNPTANGRFRKIEVRVKRPDVRVSARRGYFAMTPEMAAAAASPGPVAGPSAVDEALGRLSSLRADAEMFVTGVAGRTGIDVAIEIAAATAKREGWSGPQTLQVFSTSAEGRTTNATVELADGERGGRVTLPIADVGTGPWQVVVTAAGRDRRIEQRTPVAADASHLVGQPLAFRATPSPRSPLRPLADARLSRLERLRVEWPILGEADAHTARLLDRTGRPLGQPLPFTPLPADRQALAIDIPMGALPEGDYVVELVATRGGESERRLLAFRVVR